MVKYEAEPEGRAEAVRDLARIRSLMERATEFSHLSGVSLLIAGALASGGVVLCRILRVNFNVPWEARILGLVWSAVFLLALVQAVAFTIANARRKGEAAWSSLSRQVVTAMLPAVFAGAALTGYGLQTGQLDLLPPCWMLAYGSSLMGLGLFAGWRFRLLAVAFLAMGAASLFLWKEYGLRTLLASFGGFHLLMGLWILWKPRA